MSVLDALSTFLSDHKAAFKAKSPVLVACSGGPDSVALVHALSRLPDAASRRFHLAHVNHGLRGRSSAADAAFVRKLASSLGWPYHEARIVLSRRAGGLEERAREQRYAALRRMARRAGASAIFTAHTLDDQVETVLMNLLRGTSGDGLTGIHPLRKPEGWAVTLARPLLGAAKKDVLRFLSAHQLSFRLDGSNRRQDYFRNWIRLRVVPLLESRAPGFQRRVATMAEILREEQVFWRDEVDAVKRRVFRRTSAGALLDLEKLLRYRPAIQRRLLREVAGKDLLTFDGLERLRRWMSAPPSNGRTWQLRKGWIAERLSKSKGSPSTKLFWLGQPPRGPKSFSRTHKRIKRIG